MAHRKMPAARHILSYAQTLRGGGVERALLRLTRAWTDAGRRVTLVIGSDEGPLAAELPAGVETIILGSPRYCALRALPGIVRDKRPDVIFCPGSHYTSIALWAWLRLRLRLRDCPPIVGKVSNAPTRADHGAAMAALHRTWLRVHPLFLNRIVAMTPATAAEIVGATGIAASRVTVIPNPPAMPIPGAAIPPLPAGRFILGVGRLAPQKRWDRLIAALPRLRGRDASLIILGEGEERSALAALAAALGVADRVSMPGHVADPMPVMARAAVVALTSDYEGVPGVLREALAMGAPVVSTDNSRGVAEIVTTPALGSIVPRDDADALVSALDHWLDPGVLRPSPVAPPGDDSAARYLALFDSLVTPA